MRFNINSKTRSIDNNYSKLAVQGENKIEVVKFVAPKIVGQADLSGVDVKCLLNATTASGGNILKVLPIAIDGENIVVTWEVGLEETSEVGFLKLALHFSTAFNNVFKTLPTTFEVMATINVESEQPVLFSPRQKRSMPMLFSVAPEVDEINVIDNKLIIPAKLQNIAVQNDNESKKVNIIMPRYYQTEDLSRYPIKLHLQVNDGSSEWITFTPVVVGNDLKLEWTVQRPHTSYAGKLRMQIEVGDIATDTFFKQTEITEVNILNSLDGDTPIVPVSPPEFAMYLSQMDNIKIQTIAAKDTAVFNAKDASTSAKNASLSDASALSSKNAAAQSAENANISEKNSRASELSAESEADRAKTEADRSENEADRSKSEADRAAQAAGFDPADYYGAEEGARLEREKANWDAGMQTGERFITLPPCESTTAAVKAYGSTAQKTSAQGKNLWGGPTQWPLIKQGVTVSYDAAADEYILNGTFGATDGSLGTINLMPYTVTAGQKLTLTVYNVSGSMTGQLILIARLLKSTAPMTAVTSGRRVEFSIVSDVPSRSGTVIVTQEDAQEAVAMEMKLWTNAAPITYTNYRFKVQVEIGEKTAWERFTPQSPSPDYPAPMKGVGESGALEVAVCGKNLWGGTTQWPTTTRGVTLDYDPVTDEYTANGTLSGVGTLASIGKIPFQAVKGQKITLSTYKVSGTMTGHIMPGAELLDAAGRLTPRAIVEGWVAAEASSASFSYIVTDAAAENTTRLYMTIWLSDYLPTTFTNYRFKVQLEIGEKTAWERFTPQSVRIPLTAPLYSLPSGVRDTVDIESGTITRRVGKLVLDGRHNMAMRNRTPSSLICKMTTFFSMGTSLYSAASDPSCISDILPNKNDVWLKDIEGFMFGGGLGKEPYIGIAKSRIAGWSDDLTNAQKLALFKAWLAANPVTVLYELETPTEERIDPALLPVYANGTTLYSPDVVPPPLEATVLDPRPVSAARSLSGYAARQMESKADKSWVDSALAEKANRTKNILELLTASTQNELDTIFNNTSIGYDPGTDYAFRLKIIHNSPTFGGGTYQFSGFKTDLQYETQEITRYDANGVRAWVRSKYSGTWKAWQETTSRIIEWTPHLYGSNGAEISLSSKSGTAVIGGRQATCRFSISVSNINGATGYLKLKGYPFLILPGSEFAIGGYMNDMATSIYSSYNGASLSDGSETVFRTVYAQGGISNASTIRTEDIKAGTLLQGTFSVITV